MDFIFHWAGRIVRIFFVSSGDKEQKQSNKSCVPGRKFSVAC